MQIQFFMKKYLLLFLILAPGFLLGQFAVIYDKDGYCNVRSSAGKNNNIIDKLQNGQLVYYFEANANWVSIDYTKNKKECNGQVYKDRLIPVLGFAAIETTVKENNSIILEKDSIKIIITQQQFNRAKHKLSFFKEYKDQLEFIDNKKYWGTDGGIPKTAYGSVTIFIGPEK
jgi:hypothetical protein